MKTTLRDEMHAIHLDEDCPFAASLADILDCMHQNQTTLEWREMTMYYLIKRRSLAIRQQEIDILNEVIERVLSTFNSKI